MALQKFPEEYIFDERDLPAGSEWRMRDVLRELTAGRFPPEFQRFFDRDPERTTPAGEGIVVSPADGLVEIRRAPDAVEFVVHLRLTDVHVQRVPLAGTVASVEDGGAGFFYPDDEKYWSGVRKTTTIDSPYGRYSVHQMTTLITRRIETYLRPGDAVETGRRLGRIRLGSTVLLRFPGTCEPLVSPGDRVSAGESILARLAKTPRQATL
ncbi:MAG: phosphatidylserine decarboxylase [Elusimicrobia bacterium]|nr:phosphatidylserine decarboxylase [Elusimicrobiota bacterium]